MSTTTRTPPPTTSPLLNLPPELRNAIYDHLASSPQPIDLQSGGDPSRLSTHCAPLAGVCHQLRQEFSAAYHATTLAHAHTITIHNTDLAAKPFLRTLSRLPAPADTNPHRAISLHLHLTNALRPTDITAFVAHLAAAAITPPSSSSAGAQISYGLSFDPKAFDLYSFRIVFARLAKRYRFHRCDAEQRVWEQVYWAFAEAAERVDGVRVRQYALGQWRGSGGGICFV
ncbi:hypothetical protein Tdes44962_MAKER08939 [Teratosphaeria destructans]|uniref:F-box domain-containing protein n=1 Tax=Teratosphaeria destructans TaxID=418781 RepID=A0A9W7SUX0_9PEZI|nr:hypothetical protein Tdes44962_MAKER08939 [Teratosphaeria destructans]